MRRASVTQRLVSASPRLAFLLFAILGICGVAAAYAADAGSGKPSESVFLIEILILVCAGRLCGELMRRIGQPSVMGQLIAGVLLGPSVFGALWPTAQHAIFASGAAQKSMVDAVATLGVLMLLLLAGMETDLGLVRRTGRASASVSIAGICLPFICGFVLGQYLPDSLLPDPKDRFAGALLLGTALSISSVKIVAMVVREMNFLRRDVGQVILGSAVIDDTIGWIIIAITLSLIEHGSFDAMQLAKSVLGTAVFLGLSFTVGRHLVFWLIRWTNDNFKSELPVISLVLALTFGMAVTTDAIGVHDVLGAFVAGILVGESPILSRQIDQQLRGLITGLFMPVFFGLAGLTADLTVLKDPALLLLTGGLIAIATLGKFSGAFIGGTLGGLSFRESLAIGCGMNARGSTEVIVATIGLSMGVLSQNLFTMIVAMAILTTLAMPPMLRWALGRLPMRPGERERIEREEFEAKGFMPNVERLLLAVDDSPNGKFAARLTGLLAGRRGIPTTLLRVREQDRKGAVEANEDSPEADLKAGAKESRKAQQQDEQKSADASAAEKGGKAAKQPEKPKVPVTKARAEPDSAEAAVAKESEKGYDLLILGVAETLGPDGALHEDLAKIATGFAGPLGVVIGRGPHLEDPTVSRFKILVPVSGNNVSRRAAEVAVALARANDIPITFLYVAGGDRKNRGVAALHRHELAVLKELVAWAERYDTEARTAIHTNIAPQEAILRELKRGKFDLVVMGVNRRPGDSLFFGNVAGAVIEDAKASVLLLSS